MRGVPVKDFPSYFWEKVLINDGASCWIWTGVKNIAGYGYVDQYKRHNVPRMAHRISYHLTNGPIPDGLLVLHKCDNPSCVNPSHLFLGTQKDNMRDCVEKGRKPRGPEHAARIKEVALKGESNKNSKLTESDVLSIRSDQRTLGEIAKHYGVILNTVWRIKKRLAWSHI